jgi:hypothetical protein
MKMKLVYSLLVFALLLGGIRLFAQEKAETRTILGDGTAISTQNLGFFLAPSYNLTQMDGGHTSLFNLRGGLNIKDQFSIGGYFHTSLNEINPQSETASGVYMDYWSVGGFVEYTLLSRRTFHVTFPVFVGYGEVEMDNERGDAGLGEANFFQVEPSALLEINLHRYLRLNIGAGYRWLGPMTYRNFSHTDMAGLTGHIGMKFGLFKN